MYRNSVEQEHDVHVHRTSEGLFNFIFQSLLTKTMLNADGISVTVQTGLGADVANKIACFFILQWHLTDYI
jgi:hypothetical protein